MNDISIGAVGAAIVAGLVSLLGLVIGKEQKISEFRQLWIDELRKCMISYLININAISDLLQLEKAGNPKNDAAKLARIQSLNEASHGITLRVNVREKSSKAVIKAMSEFESIGLNSANLTPDRIKSAEKVFIKASKRLLKFEWKRVKNGEPTFRMTKWAVIILLVTLFLIQGFLLQQRLKSDQDAKPTISLPFFAR